ncbi:hypothetical protein PFISCL1PPCAC_17425, partial [Pristionchus fissidentatus]
ENQDEDREYLIVCSALEMDPTLLELAKQAARNLPPAYIHSALPQQLRDLFLTFQRWGEDDALWDSSATLNPDHQPDRYRSNYVCAPEVTSDEDGEDPNEEHN